jgi:phage terminase large subunit
MKLEIPQKFKVLFPNRPDLGIYGDYRPSTFKVGMSGRGGLKTWQFARALLLHATLRPIRVFCGRETLVSIKQSVLHEFEEQIGMLELNAHFEVGKTEIVGANGSQFIFGGLRVDPESLKSMGHIDFTWIEEASGVTQRSLDILLPTVLRTPGAEVWFSYNPENDDDPVHKRFAIDGDPDCILIKSSWQDAKEMGWLTPQMEAEKDKAYASDAENAEHIWGGSTRKRNIAAIFADKCVVQEFTPGSDWLGPYFGADWGFSNDPAVLRKHWVANGNLYIEEEAFGVGIDIPELPTLFTEVTGWWRFEFDTKRKRFLSTKIPLPNVKILSDSSRPETISQMANMSVPCVAAQKWPGCVEDGIAILRGFKNIIIHPRCTNAVDEAKNYRYKVDKATGKVTTLIVDANNHGWDATRYAMEHVILSGEQTIITTYDSVQQSNISISPELDAIEDLPFFEVLGSMTF